MAPVVSEEYKERKRNEILTHALKCFAEKGYQATTIDDIVARSSLSKGSIYTYFKSKEDILIGIMKTRNFGNIQEEFAKHTRAIDKIASIFDFYKRLFSEKRVLEISKVNTEFSLHATRNPVLQEKIIKGAGNHDQIIFNLLEEGIQEKDINPEIDPLHISRLLWSILDGIALHCFSYEEDYPFEQVMDEAKEMFVDLIKK